jgi:hypothetical protein
MKRICLALIVVSLLFIGETWYLSPAHAAPHATYNLVKSSVGSSGSGSTGSYHLSSSLGQSDAGEVSAGNYTLGGGFWGGGVIVPVMNHYLVYVPFVLK